MTCLTFGADVMWKMQVSMELSKVTEVFLLWALHQPFSCCV